MIEWVQPSTLRTTLGDLDFNVAGPYGLFLLDQTACKIRRSHRAVSDPIPQGDGEILHRRFTDGIEIDLAIQLWADTENPACDAQARLMHEVLSYFLSTMLNNAGRFLWQPSDYGDERMLDEARWLVPVDTSFSDRGVVSVTFTIDSPFPYMIDGTQRLENLVDTVPLNVTNAGNAAFYPQIIVDGPTTTFGIENQTYDEMIFYDGLRPGAQAILGGETADFDSFQQKVYLNGNEDNLKAGVEPGLTDYFAIYPGLNVIELNGANTARILMNDAWLP